MTTSSARVWQQVQRGLAAVLEALAYSNANGSKDFHYEKRTAEPTNLAGQAAWFIYLNQTSWNGLWQVNKWGQYNVPWGDRAYRGIDEDVLHAISDTLIGATIATYDFRSTPEKPLAGAFVYLDPPYLPFSDTSKFYLYTTKRFRAPDLAELAESCNQLSDRGVTWAMSNRDTQQVRDLLLGMRPCASHLNDRLRPRTGATSRQGDRPRRSSSGGDGQWSRSA